MRAVNNHFISSFRSIKCIYVSIILLILLQYISFYRTKSAVINYEILGWDGEQSPAVWRKKLLQVDCRENTKCQFSLESIQNTGFGGAILLDTYNGISDINQLSANVFSNNKRNDEKSKVVYLAFANLLRTNVDNFLQVIDDTHLWITTRFSVIVPQPYQTIVQGMVLGKGGYLSEHLSHSIETMGIQHIFSVSGANFTVLASMLALSLQGISRRRQVWIIVILSIFYALLVGKQFPVIRSCAMYLYNLIGRSYLHMQVQPLFGLTVWVGLVLFWFPESFESISFQLTVAATLGILVLYRPILGLSGRLLEGKTVLLQLLDPVLLGISVFLFVAPILSLHFESISFAGLFYTAALFWLVQLVSIVGFATLGYICISSIILGTCLLEYSDALVGVMVSLTALPLVSVLQWGTSAPSFALPTSTTLQLVLWIIVAGAGLARVYAWWNLPFPRSISASLVQEQYEKNIRIG